MSPQQEMSSHAKSMYSTVQGAEVSRVHPGGPFYASIPRSWCDENYKKLKLCLVMENEYVMPPCLLLYILLKKNGANLTYNFDRLGYLLTHLISVRSTDLRRLSANQTRRLKVMTIFSKFKSWSLILKPRFGSIPSCLVNVDMKRA